jgi:aspartyl-tRNA(Asn)/glutamyl-tRNA(Gln) amidotransferase subunit B
MPELPQAMAERFQLEYALPAHDASMMTQSRAIAAYFEAAARASGQGKLVANWLMGEVSRRLNAGDISIEQCPVSPQQLADLVVQIAAGKIHHKQAKQVFEYLWPENLIVQLTGVEVRVEAGSVTAVIESLGLEQMSDSGALEAIIDQVIAANPKSVAEYRAGKDKAFNALVGQVMKASKGKANPALVNELLARSLA